jgi:uncharacterized protein YceK
MKRILVLSLFATMALGLLSGCGAVSSRATPEAYRDAIQSRTRTLVATNMQHYGASSWWGTSPMVGGQFGGGQFAGGQFGSPISSYPQLWQVVTNHLLGFLSAPGFQFNATNYVDYVTRLTRLCIVLTRPWSPAWAMGLNYGGIGSFDFNQRPSILPVTYLGHPNDFMLQPQQNSWFSMYLGGIFGP